MRPLPAFLAIAALAFAGCGADEKESSAKEAPAGDAAALVELQTAAADLVRETGYEDKPGSTRAYDAAKEAFAEAALGESAAGPSEEIEEALHEVDEALGGGDFDEANRAAQEVLDASNEAAEAITGSEKVPLEGLDAQLDALKSAARDITEEIRNQDKPGSRRAYQAFADLFEQTEEPLAERSSEAAEGIERALSRVDGDLDSGDADRIAHAGDELAEAVERAGEQTG